MHKTYDEMKKSIGVQFAIVDDIPELWINGEFIAGWSPNILERVNAESFTFINTITNNAYEHGRHTKETELQAQMRKFLGI